MPGPHVPPPFTAALETVDGNACVRFAGELDLATLPDAEAAVARALRESPGPLRLDLSQLTFLDSSGLRLVMEVAAACRTDGGRLTIVPGPRSVQRVFEIAGMLELLPFEAPDR